MELIRWCRESRRSFAFVAAAGLSILAGRVMAGDYDPLKLAPDAKVQTIDFTVHDAERERDLPLRVFLPSANPGDPKAVPVALFSHGLGGTKEGNAFLGTHWAKRGYIAVFLQHPGSDDSVWKNQPNAKRMSAMESAASSENFLLRVKDVPVVLDQLAKWNAESSHALAGRLDLLHIGMSGHSFGAQTTQAVAGQSVPLLGPRYTDARIKAAIVMSPSSPRRGGDPKNSFGKVKLPWLLLTGTKDTSPIGGQTIEMRLAVYPALPTGDKYELVLHNAEHSAFTERALPGDREGRNPNHHRVILALTTAFWDAYLKEDATAKDWLTGSAPRAIMQTEDRWQHK